MPRSPRASRLAQLLQQQIQQRAALSPQQTMPPLQPATTGVGLLGTAVGPVVTLHRAKRGRHLPPLLPPPIGKPFRFG